MSILSFLWQPAKHQTGVYKIVNRKTGWIYVGATTQPIVVRWDQHRRRLQNNTHHNSRLQSDWRAYGERAFRFSVVEVVGADRVFEREKDWQRSYYPTGKCYNPNPDALPSWLRPSDFTRESLLSMFREMRAAGIAREQARQQLKEHGISLDNNLWARAGRS
jgi:group I intron endonuclease